MNGYFIYKDSKLKEISFPLGGIGTGCIGLSGNGRLIDWEIFNRPNKGCVNGLTHFAIKAESSGRLLDARVLNGDFPAPYSGKYSNKGAYGHGPDRATMAGMPHFKNVEFNGEFPVAKLGFSDEKFPGKVEMTASNPFIPLNEKDSSIPGAFFELSVTNNTDMPLEYSICFAVNNPNSGGTINRFEAVNKIKSIRLLSGRNTENYLEYGDLTVATDSEDISYQEYLYRGSWFDNLTLFWKDFTKPGKLINRTYGSPAESNDVCSLAVHMNVAPGQSGHARFVLTWNYPNCHNYWNPGKCSCGSCDCSQQKPKSWKNYYVKNFKSSAESAIYSLENWGRLFEQTMQFKNALFSSSLPAEILDAVSANISILKTPTCLRLEDGSFYGFEGCNCDSGCCEGSCTHVWNYAYALPFLFPSLERSMRDLDFKYNQREDGSMSFRLQLPVGRERSQFRACADGQFGGVIKMYRDWKISGDTEWLKSNWAAVKKSIEFAWSDTNKDKWDADKDGVLEGRQHHTLDMELFGPNSWLTGFYLAALKAGAEMAEYLGEDPTAAEYRELFEKGRAWVDVNLFNGEYFYQKIDLKDRSIVEEFDDKNSLTDDSALKSYWNDEAGEIKYQIGNGCGVDQVVAQWHADICGLGDIFDKDKTQKALQSIYKYNFKKSVRDFFNPCRIYCMNDEGGVVMFEWPEGVYKPLVPVPYAEETMNGFEYQAASHLIRRGFTENGLEIVKAIRDRYDGERRNPWNEFECGSNYARSMASYDLLLAFSGFEFDMTVGMIGFNPVLNGSGNFKCFWSLDSGWGMIEIKPDSIKLSVLYGKLEINELKLPFLAGRKVNIAIPAISDNGFSLGDSIIIFGEGLLITVANPLLIELT